MISFDQALATLLSAARCTGVEVVPLEEVEGRVLADDIASDIDLPPFAKAAMDGYACRRCDLPGPLTIIEEIPAGRTPEKSLGPMTCARIMTGAMLPEGADCVLPWEEADAQGEQVRAIASPADNLCPRGEDLRQGQQVLNAGIRLTPAGIGILASVGCANVPVARRPRVGVISTGSELVPVWRRPMGAAIRDSNGPQITAQVRRFGAAVRHLALVEDRAEALAEVLALGRATCDVLVLSGGVSAGTYDLVPEALITAGWKIRFDSVAMQPGKPATFADDGRVAVIGLPGNPVSTLVVAELLLRPFLAAMQGHVFVPRQMAVRLDREVRRRKADRRSTLPVRFTTPDTVETVEYHGSAHIGAYAAAEALLTLEPGVTRLSAGETVHVRLL